MNKLIQLPQLTETCTSVKQDYVRRINALSSTTIEMIDNVSDDLQAQINDIRTATVMKIVVNSDKPEASNVIWLRVADEE